MTLINKKLGVEYQKKQFEKPKYSTTEFEKFLNDNGCFKANTEILDIGTGGGDNVAYLAKKYPHISFLGADYNQAFINMGKEVINSLKLNNVSLTTADWFDLPEEFIGRFDGIFNVHTFCCFKQLKPALDALTKLNPRWIAFNSLFYEGPLDVMIHIRDHTNPELKDSDPDGDFNVFSLTEMEKQLAEQGYTTFKYARFNIPIDLPKPPKGARGTFTMKTEIENRAQFSGPVYLPWYFVVAMKD